MDINITLENEVYLKIECNRGIGQEIKEHFSFFAHNYKFMPTYRNKMWDGKIYLFRDNLLYAGLLGKLKEFAQMRGYSITNINLTSEVTFDTQRFIDYLGLPFPPRDYQVRSFEHTIRNKRTLLLSPTGCHREGDKILMYNGSWKNVEDISQGDYVIGSDGNPKEVLRLFSGEDHLYEISPKNNRQSITVTSEHIIPIKFSDCKSPHGYCKGDKDYIENIRVKDYLEKSDYYKHCSSVLFNNAEINFNTSQVNCKLSPYFIGLYLGDGSSHTCQITTDDQEILNHIESEALVLGCTVKKTKHQHYSISGKLGRRNIIFSELEKIGINFGGVTNRLTCENRFIPNELLHTPVEYRLELLAGLIDSDGHLANGTYYEISAKSKRMIDDIEILAISLGLVVSKRVKYNKKLDRNYYAINIMGDISKVPCKVPRKQASEKQRCKDPYRSSFNIIDKGYGKYYGFEVEDNYYVTNGGMITHNSGKSLYIYMMVRYLMLTKKKGLLLVPTVSLVSQMYKDFKSYGWGEVENHCHLIYSGKDKVSPKFLDISTWQSIYNLRGKHFEQYDFIITDECHLAKAKSLIGIVDKCINADHRIGTTGTLDGMEVNKMTLEGLFGDTFNSTSTSELIDQGNLTKLQIKCLVLKYPDTITRETKSLDYQGEIDFIISNRARNVFIKNLAGSLNNNTLILFQYIEKHGDLLYELLTQLEGKKVFYVHGNTSPEERERIREATERELNIIILASYGVYSTGVNIKNLDNIIFATSGKSRVRNLQSIGRGLRLNKGKEYATLYDITDDLRYKKYTNHTLKHLQERVKIYSSEKFPYKIYPIPFSG